jgi:hypothetical protein
MKWIRIGNHVLNPEAIIEVIDEGERDLKAGKQRVVKLKLSNGQDLNVAGAGAVQIWKKITEDPEVWSETYEEPQYKLGFH